MRFLFALLFIGLACSLFAQNTIIGHSNSYYINMKNDTVFGLIKIDRKSESFRFVKDDSWNEEKIHHSNVKSFYKDGAHFVKQSYKGKTKFLQDLGDGVYQLHYKREKFYNYYVEDDLSWPNNGHLEMKYKYKVVANDSTLYINRFNYHSILKKHFELSDELASNCHFYEFELDISELKD